DGRLARLADLVEVGHPAARPGVRDAELFGGRHIDVSEVQDVVPARLETRLATAVTQGRQAHADPTPPLPAVQPHPENRNLARHAAHSIRRSSAGRPARNGVLASPATWSSTRIAATPLASGRGSASSPCRIRARRRTIGRGICWPNG